MLRLFTLAPIALCALMGLSSVATAASYGSLNDPTGTVRYENVQDINGLFGAPSVSLDSLDFTPTAFQAQCTQCPLGVSVSDTLTLDLQARSLRQLETIQITEGLDYSIHSFDSTGLAGVSVIAHVIVQIIGVDGIAVSGLNHQVDVALTPPSATVFGLGAQSSGVILGNTGLINLQSLLTLDGREGEVTRVRLSFDNTLTAFHDGIGGQARIRKRDADFVSLTVVGSSITPFPEPTTAVLLMSGLALLAGRRPRG